MNGSKQPKINLMMPAVAPALGQNSKALLTLWKADMQRLVRTSSTPVLDEFHAVRHDVSAAETRRVSAVDDDPITPERSDAASGERFRGKHGDLVVMKRK